MFTIYSRGFGVTSTGWRERTAKARQDKRKTEKDEYNLKLIYILSIFRILRERERERERERTFILAGKVSNSRLLFMLAVYEIMNTVLNVFIFPYLEVGLIFR